MLVPSSGSGSIADAGCLPDVGIVEVFKYGIKPGGYQGNVDKDMIQWCCDLYGGSVPLVQGGYSVGPARLQGELSFYNRGKSTR